jgi:hypothetical protein
VVAPEAALLLENEAREGLAHRAEAEEADAEAVRVRHEAAEFTSRA